jgi:hypothetical protein
MPFIIIFPIVLYKNARKGGRVEEGGEKRGKKTFLTLTKDRRLGKIHGKTKTCFRKVGKK